MPLWVLEDPVVDERRWYWYRSDGGTLPRLGDDVDALVEWGVSHVGSVVVRTLDMAFFFAGERPADVDEHLRPWPPSDVERAEIDRRYDEDLRGMLARRRAAEAFVAARSADLEHRTFLHRGDDVIVVDELVDGGFGAIQEERFAFGALRHVLVDVASVEADDPWVEAVARALRRERFQNLVVVRGEGVRYHVSRSSNRNSILAHGLDWPRMQGPIPPERLQLRGPGSARGARGRRPR